MADHHHDQEDDHVQCDHAHGLGKISDSEFTDDPLMQKSEWTLDDWIRMYEKFPSSKDKGRPSEELVKHVKDLLPSEPARVLVPLCGKSPDLRWLYERGNTVVGVEGVERPVREFYEVYSDLKHSVEHLPFGKLYKSSDGRLQVYVCDVTKVPPGVLGKFDAVFDWGAYTAIMPDDRQKYVEVVTEALKEGYRYFLEVCHDGPPEATGLPHSVSFRTIKLEFGPSRKMKVLGTQDISDAWGVESLFNSYILMTHKDPQ